MTVDEFTVCLIKPIECSGYLSNNTGQAYILQLPPPADAHKISHSLASGKNMNIKKMTLTY